MLQAHRVGAHAVDQDPGGRGLEPESESLRVGDEQARHLAGLRRLEVVDLALRRLDRLGQLRRRFGAGDQDDGQVGRQLGERRDDGVELAIAPALDPVGEQVAARVHQRHRRDRAQQRLVVGHPAPLAGLEDLERGGAALAFGTRSQATPRRVDLRPVGAGDQVERLHLLGHAASLDGGAVHARTRDRALILRPQPVLPRAASDSAIGAAGASGSGAGSAGASGAGTGSTGTSTGGFAVRPALRVRVRAPIRAILRRACRFRPCRCRPRSARSRPLEELDPDTGGGDGDRFGAVLRRLSGGDHRARGRMGRPLAVRRAAPAPAPATWPTARVGCARSGPGRAAFPAPLPAAPRPRRSAAPGPRRPRSVRHGVLTQARRQPDPVVNRPVARRRAGQRPQREHRRATG